MSKRFYAEEQPQLEICPIYGGMCGYPSNLCYECPRHGGAHEKPQWWTEGLQPFAQPQSTKLDEWCDDCAEMKQEFLRMASFIDCLLECSDDDKETLLGFISRLAEYMPWTERD